MKREKIANVLARTEGARGYLAKEIPALEKSIADSMDRAERIDEAQTLLQVVAQETQSALRFRVEEIVQVALDAVFESRYDFQIAFEIARGKTEARLKFISRATGVEIDPMNASGGGVVDLAAFALRLSALTLSREAPRVLLLDEPFRFLSRDLQKRAGEILCALAEKTGVQIVLVTHIAALVDSADTVITVAKNSDGRAEIS